MKSAQQILRQDFAGNITEAAKATGISRQTWHAWKRAGFPRALPPKLELYVLKRGMAKVAA